VKELKFMKMHSSDGSIHYLLKESQISEASVNGANLDVAEIKKISKKDAAKPLFIEHE
jgi:hypothetical protein